MGVYEGSGQVVKWPSLLENRAVRLFGTDYASPFHRAGSQCAGDVPLPLSVVCRLYKVTA